MPSATAPTASVGRPIDRVDGKLKVTGQARYAAEAPLPNCAHAVLVQSTIARGSIKSMDTAAAEKAPGVLAILTPLNLPKLVPLKPVKPDMMTGGIPPENRIPLSDMAIHYYGQHVAVVVADTIDRARHAARMIKIEYAAEKPVISISDPAAKTVTPQQSFGEPVQIKRGQDVDQVFSATADLTVIEHTYSTPVETHNPMEMSATTAAWDGDHLTIYDASQYVYGVRAVVADSLGIPRDNVRVMCPFIGGGFGCKGFQWPHTVLAAAAAKVVKQPVKLMLTRQQMFTSTGHRSPTVQTLKLAATHDGKLVAAKHDTTMHCNELGEFVEAAGMATTKMLYAVPNISISHTIKQVNVNIPTPMRAPGECPGTYALECAMDELANELKIDPVQLRLINHADVHPHTNKPWSSKYLKECYALASQKFGWENRKPEPRSMKDESGKLIGYGFATATYPGYRFPAVARVRLMNDNGRIRAVAACAAHDLGTGAYTVFTQITASAVGLPTEQVKFELGDTSLPYDPVAGGSNSTASVAQAITDATGALKSNLAKLAGGELANETKFELRDGALISATNPSLRASLSDLITKSGRAYVEGISPAPGDPEHGGKKADNTEEYNDQEKFAFQSFGCHFVEVRVDEPIARVRVTRVVSCMDVGRIINPKTARSQVLGGVTMGIGMALMEATEYLEKNGHPINNNLADYPVCVNPDIHEIDVHFINKPDPHLNALGCRGVGEIGITGVAAAVANAVYHATGKRVRDLPITPDKLLA